jgi:hypothetical protein
MSVQALHPQQYDAGVLGHVSAARSALQAVAEVPTGSLTVDELTEGLVELSVLESQVSAARHALLAEADARKVAQSLGATGTDAWASALTGSTRAVMAGGVWLAERLDRTYHLTREAFADGGINEEQARVIVRAAEKLPQVVTPEQRRAAEASLVAKAVNGMNARGLRQAARRMLDVVSAQLADEHEAGLLEAEERRAENETWLSLHDNGDGTFSGRFTIPELHGTLLRAALDHLTSPKRHVRDSSGELVQDESLGPAGLQLSWTERLGLGFTELIEHLPTDGFGRSGIGVLVHLDYERLLDGLAAARIDTGTHISAGEARRLACNAGIIPAVLGGRSVPLDLGDTARLHSVGQRRALSIQHDSCATEGCERPFAWCDVHHRRPWSTGGPTDLDNGLPLCGFHHRRAHDSRFDMRSLPNGDVRFRRRR